MIDQIAPHIRKDISARLAAVEAAEGVRLLMAVESGSRAWGFPSPDSDYDVRFLYVRPRRDYLGLKPFRDVIERPIVDDIDLNGWDIRKALGLLLKHNAVLSEWLESPIHYIADAPVIGKLGELATRYFDAQGYARHYASLGQGALMRWFDEGGNISVKRYFYALRPALSVRALRLDPSQRPPMNMFPLMDAARIKPELIAQIQELIRRKSQTNEASNTIRLPDIEELITEELGRAEEVASSQHQASFAEEAEALFLEMMESE